MGVLNRELTYHVPFERLMKLSRSMGRKAFRRTWLMTILWFGAFLLAIMAGPWIEQQLERTGLPGGAAIFAIGAVFFAGLFFIRAARMRDAKSRADFDAAASLREDSEGLRIGNASIEYYLKWPGIAQLMVEPDGLVISHGSLFFLVPNTAFSSLDERDAFASDIFSKINRDAQDRSIGHLPPGVVTARGV